MILLKLYIYEIIIRSTANVFKFIKLRKLLFSPRSQRGENIIKWFKYNKIIK